MVTDDGWVLEWGSVDGKVGDVRGKGRPCRHFETYLLSTVRDGGRDGEDVVDDDGGAEQAVVVIPGPHPTSSGLCRRGCRRSGSPAWITVQIYQVCHLKLDCIQVSRATNATQF